MVTALLALTAAAATGGVAGVGAQALDSATPPPSPAAPGIVSVAGSGMVEVAPDTASITAGVNIVNPKLSEAQAQATDTMGKIIAALKAAGVADKDIQTTNFSVNINQNYDSNGASSQITGYTVGNQVMVTVRDLTKLGSLLDTVVGQGANTIYGITFSVADPTPAASQARKAAVADATRRATEPAAAAGLKLGRLLSISETYGAPSAAMSYASGAGAMDKASVPVQAGTSMVSVDVQMSFELLP
ncbi:MAG: SIMPL domain-containing protein [Thermomicrobiales bacterium]